jgi:menaquinone-dependent protoporphyrinogen IX oxidase
MKALILYATKHGATLEAAHRIESALVDLDGADVELVLASVADAPSVADYDYVILGSAIYAGMIRKEMKAYLASLDTSRLQGKRVGIYLSGLLFAEEEKVFKENFSEELLGLVQAKAFVGGIFDPKKVNMAERLVMKAVAKSTDYVDNIDEDRIVQFVQTLKG